MSDLLEFLLQILMEIIRSMLEGTIEILRLDWRKRKLSKKGLIMLTIWFAIIVALIIYMVITK
ncbi:diacylglycerol kinase [Neisseria sp. HMSC065C04]|nr:diacylglycerol kinase [Neisseria sp. HMSC065C04]